MNAMPPIQARAHEASTTYLPYTLFTDLLHAGNRFAATSPFSARQPSPSDLDNALAAEDAEDGATAGIETRTLTLNSGDTFAGILQDAGVPKADANAPVTALAKVFDLRSAKAGQSVQVTFQAPPQSHPL